MLCIVIIFALTLKSASKSLSRLQGSGFMSAPPPEKRANTEIERCCEAVTLRGDSLPNNDTELRVSSLAQHGFQLKLENSHF